jgi:hypothetical protein
MNTRDFSTGHHVGDVEITGENGSFPSSPERGTPIA